MPSKKVSSLPWLSCKKIWNFFLNDKNHNFMLYLLFMKLSLEQAYLFDKNGSK